MAGARRPRRNARSRFIRHAVAAVIVVCGAGALLSFSACEERAQPSIAALPDTQAVPDQESWNTQVVFSDSGSPRAVLRARHVRMYEARRETLLDSGLAVDFYDVNGRHSSKLTADRGRVDDATKNLEAFDHVVFTSDSGTVVRTEYLFWENARRIVRSDRFVTVTKPTERLQGYGFEADQGLKNYTIYRVSGKADYDRRSR